MDNSPYLNQDPRTLDEALRMVERVPGIYSLFSPETREWLKAEAARVERDRNSQRRAA